MSILRVDEIRDNGSGFNDVVTFANNGGTENGKLARVWANFNISGTVRSSFNVNSVTDNGTGSWTVNFANSLTDANPVALYSNERREANYPYNPIAVVNSVSASSANVVNWVETVGTFDADLNLVAVFR
jgi:hypothetical protein